MTENGTNDNDTQGSAQAEELKGILMDFTISYLQDEPRELIPYAVDYFTRLKRLRTALALQEESQSPSVGSPTSPPSATTAATATTTLSTLTRSPTSSKQTTTTVQENDQ